MAIDVAIDCSEALSHRERSPPAGVLIYMSPVFEEEVLFDNTAPIR